MNDVSMRRLATRARMTRGLTGFAAALWIIGPAQALGVNSSKDCLPPQNGKYLGQFHAEYPMGGGKKFDLTNPSHLEFSSCDPPPTSGSTTHSFNSTIQGKVSANG